MKLKRAILGELGRDELKEIVEQLELADVDRRSAEAMREALGRSRRATPADFFWKMLERRRRGERRLGQDKISR